MRRDHPRSRGVYGSVSGVSTTCPGSSPLARGLRTSARARSRRSRIIPARAGFTAAQRGSLHRPPDHPRSRGVYSVVPRGGPSSGDHPRSRGVYRRRCRPVGMRSGSSPLARGLPSSSCRGPRPSRIIPARAGFTRAEMADWKRVTDHPRSRGVYELQALRPGGDWGSSPLARGLLRVRHTLPGSIRIIPARAGFTWLVFLSVSLCPDHPRSRGVYTNLFEESSAAAGSSPLARGLLRQVTTTRRRGGIIPARAGFTSLLWRRGSAGWDHPRSRGVYAGG